VVGPTAEIGIQIVGGDPGRPDAARTALDPRINMRRRQVVQPPWPGAWPSVLADEPAHESGPKRNGQAPFRSLSPILVEEPTKRKCRRFRAGIPKVIEE